MPGRSESAPLNLASFPLMLAKRGVMPHAGDWHFELKYDGYRLLMPCVCAKVAKPPAGFPSYTIPLRPFPPPAC